ncbi:MAG: lamin tail domain-containing protein [Thermomonas sp.]
MSSLMRRLALVVLLSPAAFAAHAQVVISQVWGSNGTTSAYNQDYVELFNRGATSASLNGLTVQYASATGTGNFQLAATLPNVSLGAGQHFLVGLASTAGGTSLPAPDATGGTNISGSAGKVILANSTGALACNGSSTPCSGAQLALIVDLVGYGTTANFYEGAGPAAAPGTTNATFRALNGCTDSNDNGADFAAAAAAPRNTASASTPCGGGGQPTLSIGSTSAAEGDSGTTPFFFTITSTQAAPAGGFSVDYATSDGLATTADNDYVAKSGTATIAEGETSVTIGVDVNGDTTDESNETFFVTLSNPSGAVIGTGTGTGTINNDDVALTAIHDIQGNGDASPLVGQTVTTRGIVTGRKSNGFFLQAADADADADPATSEGVYVFTSSAPPADAAVGNLVQVAATISEYVPTADPLQPPLTELVSPTVVLLSTGNALPAAVPLTATFPDPEGAYDQLERVEGMRVSAASLTVVGPTEGTTNEPNATGTSNGVFYATVTGLPRPFRTPGIQAPDPAPSGSIPPIPRWDTAPETMEVDSDAIGGAKLDLAAGAVVTGVTGPMDYGFRRYTILPEATPTVASPGNAVTAARLPSEDEFTFASYNLERFFDTVDDPTIGEPVLTPTAFANRLNKASLGIRDELHTPDVLAVMEMENLSTLQQLASKINSDAVAAGDEDPQYAAYLQEGNDVGGIDVGFLVKTAPVDGSTPRVEVVDVTQYGKDTTWIDPSNGQPSLLNDRPPLLLRAIVHYADGRSFPISAFAVHQRSLNGISDETTSGSTTAGDRVRRKRQAQAEYLANLIQGRETTDPTEHLVVLGDFNAFDFNDGYVDPMGVVTGMPTPDDQTVVPNDGVDLVEPNLLNLHYLPEANQRYSYVFDGQAQSLDHILINQALGADLAWYELDHARINADFPETNRNDANSPSRLSDHDPAIAYFAVVPATHAELEIDAGAPAGVVKVGTPAVFTVLLTNNGPDAARNPGVGFAFDAALPDLHVSNLPAGWSCGTPQVSGDTTTMACNTTSLTADSTASFTLEATAVNPVTVPGLIDMWAAATSESSDPVSSGVGLSVSQTLADLSIGLTRTGVTSGTVANFRVPVTNAGPDPSVNVLVWILGNVTSSPTIAKPAGWTCQRVTGGTLHIECQRTSPMPVGTETISFSTLVPRTQALEFSAAVLPTTPDPDSNNDIATYSKP